jgi:DNA invertase Pin-like site-specific DNA recombinase
VKGPETVIQIAKQTESAVLYLRMSDDRQERSIGDQRAELRAYADKYGYRILREYVDPGISGDDTTRRTGFLKMREDAQAGQFSVVLCWDQDRFGRFDPIEGGHWILPFRNAGVRLETIAQGKIDWTDFAGRLIYLVQQEGKHAYLRDLSRNSVRGLIAKAKEGRCADGSAPYGYRIVGGKRVVEQHEAEIVRRIFREYVRPDGGLRGIANRLNAERIPSPTGKQWKGSTIRAILVNRKHTGEFVWGKRSTGRYYANKNGEIVSRKKGDSVQSVEPIRHGNFCEAIIDVRTFDRVQQLMKDRKRGTSPIRNSPGAYVLSGLLRCGHCGSVLAGQTVPRKAGPKRIYCCAGYHFNGKAMCTMNTVPEGPLVEALVRLIQRDYLGDDVIGRIKKAIERRLGSRAVTDKADVKRLRSQIAELDKRIEQGAERVFAAPESIVDSLYAKLESLKVDRDRLAAELQAATKPVDDAKRREAKEAEAALAALYDLRTAFKRAKPADVHQLLRSLVSKVELRFSKHPAGRYTRTRFEAGIIYLRPDSECANLAIRPSRCR